MVCAEAVVTHQVDHHVKHSYYVVLSTGSEKLHVIDTSEQQVSLKQIDGLISFNMSVCFFFILELIHKSEIDDGNSEFRRIEHLLILVAYHNILGLHVVESSSGFVHNLHDAYQLEMDR